MRNTSQKSSGGRTAAIVLSVAVAVLTLLAGVFIALMADPYADKPASSAAAMLPADDDTSAADGSGTDTDQPDASDSEPEPDASGEDASEPDGSGASTGTSGSGASSAPDSGAEPEQIFYNVPSELRAVMISAGGDYLTAAGAPEAAVRAEIDKAVAAAKDLTMNSVIIDTKFGDSVLFESAAQPMAGSFDCVGYLAEKAREAGLYVYATYDVCDLVDGDGNYQRASNADGAALTDVMRAAGEFAGTYKLDGVLLSNYYNPAGADSYASYLQFGGGIGYQNYLRQVPRALVTAAADAMRRAAPGTQVGLLTCAVWENAAANPDGSETAAEFTALGSGNADVRAMVEDGLFDFVMVEDYGSTADTAAPFEKVAAWWSAAARGANTGLYILHAADRVGTQAAGYGAYEQLTKQVIALQELSGVSGSAFNSLKAMQANQNSTTTLVQYLNNEINEEWVLTQLAVTNPPYLTFTTKEQTVVFQGASDPQAEVTLNGEKIPTNESGYFSIREDLKSGLNTFAIAHKGKQFVYNITRQVEIIKEVSPTGSVKVDGGMEVTVSALAYADAAVTATVNGQRITLSLSDAEGDEVERDSDYQLFTGVFTAPSASVTATQLGSITFSATAQGETQTREGASVTVNKKAVMGDGAVVYVVSDQAETFPTNTINDNSDETCFPLPKGTMDKSYGDEISYTFVNSSGVRTTKRYWKLESGVRVYSEDIKATNSDLPSQNRISDMAVKSSGAYTTVTLDTESKVPYKVAYDGSGITFKFEYTSTAPDSSDIRSNALFKSAEWKGSNLTLTFKKTGGFLGYKAYYEGDSLVLRFNNSPGALSGARIVIDPGHGGSDPGTLGFYPGKDEADINLAIARKVASDLKDQGATVLMTTPGSTMATRMAAARSFNPQALVSIHGNSSQNASATGTEVYYFYPFQKQLAANIAANVSNAMGNPNRGAKAGLYYMTRESQFACVLAEIGFLSNDGEYSRLISSKTQNKVAGAISNAIGSYLGGAGSGQDYSDDAGEDEDVDDEDVDDEDGDDEDGDDEVTGVRLNEDSVTLEEGEAFVLKATVKPSSAGNKDVYWESEDEEVATVNGSGKVTARGEGSTYIIVTTDDGEHTAECEVVVGEPDGGGEVTRIIVEAEYEEIEVDERVTLTADVRPSDADDTRVKWVTDDDDIVRISNVGSDSCKVEGLRDGAATVTAIARDGSNVEGSVTITVGSG